MTSGSDGDGTGKRRAFLSAVAGGVAGAVGLAGLSPSGSGWWDDGGGGGSADGDGGDGRRGGFPPDSTEYGRAVALGDGEVRPFTTTTRAGEPRYHGVVFDDGVFEGLPSGEELRASDGGAETDKYRAHGQALEVHTNWSKEYFVPFPDAAATPFTFLGLNWNPNGHPGAKGAWLVPHFDVHFHTLDPATVDAISGPRPAPYGDIPRELVPPGYGRGTVAEQRYVTDMGEHLAPEDAPELPDGPDAPATPEAFTSTLIQGFADASGPDDPPTPRLSFVEPMVTREYLAGFEGVEEFGVPQPETYPHDGQHPTGYAVRETDDGVAVVLRGFEPTP